MMEPREISLTIRMAAETRKALGARAAEQRRSINAHILHLIDMDLRLAHQVEIEREQATQPAQT